MTQQLRDELARIGDGAPRLDLPEDLWSRGRRARRQARVLAAGAAACLVLAMLGVTSAVVGRAPVPQPAGPPPAAPAVPQALYPVPEHVQLDSAQASPVDAIGRAAAAFMTEGGVPVLVDAADGSHDPVRLPGWEGVDSSAPWAFRVGTSRPLALSPDGRRLAWVWATAAGEGDARTGVAVADLEDGTVDRRRIAPLPGHTVVDVRSVTWSPDGRWVAWSGRSLPSFDARVLDGEGTSALGRFVPGDPGATPTFEAASAHFSLTVTGDGSLVEAARSGAVRVRGTDGRPTDFDVRRRGLDHAPVGAATPDGRRVALAVTGGESPVEVLDLVGQRMEDREPPLSSPFGQITPLGWFDAGAVLLANEGDWRHLDGGKVVSTPEASREEFRDRTFVRSVPASSRREALEHLSLATNLVTPGRLSVTRPEPDWPWSPAQRVAVAGVSVGVLLLGAVLLWWRRRWA